MIDTLSLQCSTTAEVTQIKHELSRFQREQHEPFSNAVARFDSLYSHLSTNQQKQIVKIIATNIETHHTIPHI